MGSTWTDESTAPGRANVVGVVGVVGAGTMGAGIAQVGLEAGARVLLFDVDPTAFARARDRIADGLARRARRLAAGSPEPAGGTARPTGLDRLVAAPDLETLGREAGIVVEAALEDLALKRRIFATLDSIAPPVTILATNTSALAVASIADGAGRHPGRVVGLHFFNPAPVMNLVEVVAPPGADPVAVARATTIVEAWGKTPVRTADTPGFIVNRVNRPFTLEALGMLEAGIGSVEAIDAALRADGYPMGPFELMDLIGIDVNLAAARGIFQAFRYESRFRPSVIQERLVEAGRFGRKTGEGFYWYAEDGRSLGMAGAFIEGSVGTVEAGPVGPRMLPGGEAGSPTTDTTAALDAIASRDPLAERIILAVVNEAYRAVGDGVASPSDIDLAMRLGAGHPRGPFEQVEWAGGPRAVLDRLRRIGGGTDQPGGRFDPAPLLLAAAAADR